MRFLRRTFRLCNSRGATHEGTLGFVAWTNIKWVAQVAGL